MQEGGSAEEAYGLQAADCSGVSDEGGRGRTDGIHHRIPADIHPRIGLAASSPASVQPQHVTLSRRPRLATRRICCTSRPVTLLADVSPYRSKWPRRGRRRAFWPD